MLKLVVYLSDCLAHCKECTDGSTCEKCDSGYFWDSTERICQGEKTVHFHFKLISSLSKLRYADLSSWVIPTELILKW